VVPNLVILLELDSNRIKKIDLPLPISVFSDFVKSLSSIVPSSVSPVANDDNRLGKLEGSATDFF
jgi:hypothetical protein